MSERCAEVIEHRCIQSPQLSSDIFQGVLSSYHGGLSVGCARGGENVECLTLFRGGRHNFPRSWIDDLHHDKWKGFMVR